MKKMLLTLLVVSTVALPAHTEIKAKDCLKKYMTKQNIAATIALASLIRYAMKKPNPDRLTATELFSPHSHSLLGHCAQIWDDIVIGYHEYKEKKSDKTKVVVIMDKGGNIQRVETKDESAKPYGIIGNLHASFDKICYAFLLLAAIQKNSETMTKYVDSFFGTHTSDSLKSLVSSKQ